MSSVHALNVTKMAHDGMPYILLVGALITNTCGDLKRIDPGLDSLHDQHV